MQIDPDALQTLYPELRRIARLDMAARQ